MKLCIEISICLWIISFAGLVYGAIPHLSCQVTNNLTGGVYTFTQGSENPSSVVFNVTSFSNVETWSFFFKFCDRVDSMFGDYKEIDQNQWIGWNHGYMSEFKTVSHEWGWDYFQEYTVGDSGYNCLQGRTTSVYIYCNNCPQGSSCTYGNSTFCICSASYNRETNPCTAVLFVSASCPAPYFPPPPPTPPGTPAGEIVGIFFVILFILGTIGCVGGYVYNYKVHNRRGKEAIPGFKLITRGTERFAGSTYQRTAQDSTATYGTLQ